MKVLRPISFQLLTSTTLAVILATLQACGSEVAVGPDTAPFTDVFEDIAPEPGDLDKGDAVDDDAPLPPPDMAPAGPFCGDGNIDPGETCDDGPANGEWNRCGFGCNGPGIRCGNGFIEPDHEACDDGDRNGQYGRCAPDCQGPGLFCGDGIVTRPWENCDDGARNGDNGACPSDCNPVPGCGDGQVVAPEICDEGPLNGQYARCAYDCSGLGPHCGDGRRDKQEACDDGWSNGIYGFCAIGCAGPGPRCGDGRIDSDRELCGDGEANGRPGRCNTTCSATVNGFIIQPDGLPRPTGDSCREDDLLAKYMVYRKRLRGDGTARNPGFVVIGEGEGRSMPASRREPGTNCAGHWKFGACPRPDLGDAGGVYNWGDGTVWHGEYLAVLALEYAMFTRLGWPADETLADLRLALLALDRVDERAETYYADVPPARDGFFVRDDVPVDLHLLPGGGYRFPRNDGYAGYECVSGDLLCDPPDIDDGSFTSQDQTIALMYGLALVNKLVPEGVVVNGLSPAPDAREKVHRLVWFLRRNGWKVKDPEGGVPPDRWGGNAIGFSDAMARVANIVVGDEHGVDDYRNFASRTLGEVSWSGLQAIWESTHAYNRSHALKLAAANNVWDARKLANMSMSDGKDHYVLVWSLLHDRPVDAPFSDWRIESLLRSAPCGGPCRGFGCANEAPGWMGESRTVNPEDRMGSKHYEGEGNGLDYMLVYAAYFLHRNGLFTVARPETPSACRDFRGVERIAFEGAIDGETWDPNGACARWADLGREYCGRPFGAWLDDASQGKVAIFAGGARWTCVGGGVCTLARTSEQNTSGDDLILGTAGTDTLRGEAGNDCLVGFAGADVLRGGQGYDTLDGGDGDDALYGENSGVVVDGEGDILLGGRGNDQLFGGPGKDEIHGGDGDDRLEGGAGDDWLLGGPGSDRLFGEGGEDTLLGQGGDDWLDGGWGDDQCWGGDGRDRLDGDLGADFLHGGYGPDFIRGGDGRDRLFSGDDWETNQLAVDRLCGNGGDDEIWGGWDGDACLGGGWFLGGTDVLNGCDDDTATTDACDKGAWENW
jgi:hypothetical protein